MMKIALLLICAFFCVPGSLFGAQKVGTADLQRIFEGFWKTKEAEAEMNDLRSDVKRQLDVKADGLKSQENEISKLDGRAGEFADNAIILREREAKIANWQKASKENTAFAQEKDKLLADRTLGMRTKLFEEISKVIEDYARVEGFDLIFDRSGKSISNVPIILRSAPQFDITEAILARLYAGGIAVAGGLNQSQPALSFSDPSLTNPDVYGATPAVLAPTEIARADGNRETVPKPSDSIHQPGTRHPGSSTAAPLPPVAPATIDQAELKSVAGWSIQQACIAAGLLGAATLLLRRRKRARSWGA